ncbi:hypothetical protein CLV86_0900 [Lacinutrix venerupis]|nr:hypothetical protein CLV86_0900 [Lacinutrix venerupis]
MIVDNFIKKAFQNINLKGFFNFENVLNKKQLTIFVA